jgi:5-methyltetrahydropteroyltriglutamate--homocysteine methyltransferase
MPGAKPPFRADHVGSLLRPAALKAARARHARGDIGDAALRAIEDREIDAVVRRQQDTGLRVATDGEFRRAWWHFDFLRGLDGCKLVPSAHGIAFTASRPRPRPCRW